MNRVALEELADRLLLTLRRRADFPQSKQRLATKLECDSSQLLDAILILAGWGYRLRMNSETVAFVAAPDSLTATEIGYRLKTKLIAQEILAYRSVKSTNDLARDLADSGAAEGTIVVAEEQTKGRGRFKRVWHSPPGTGIYMSLILRPDLKPEQAPGLSIMTALALADAIGRYLPGRVMIKWPNDILIGRPKSSRARKTAGILTELTAEKNRIQHVIVGVGINVNQGVGNFPEELRPVATSIRRALRQKLNRVELLQYFLVNFEKLYLVYLKEGLAPMQRRLKKISYLMGREIEVTSQNGNLRGRVVDIDHLGQLIIQTDRGEQPLTAGEVTIVKN